MKESEIAEIERLVDVAESRFARTNDSRITEDVRYSRAALDVLATDETEGLLTQWAKELIESGIYKKIVSGLRMESLSDIQMVHRVNLSNQIIHPWRGGIYSGLVFIRSNKYSADPDSPVCSVGRNPLLGMNWVVARGAPEREAQFKLTEPKELAAKTHPILVVEFADQIRRGVIWDRMRESLRSGPIKRATEEDRRQDSIRRYQLRDQYVARWRNLR